jgi:hypothetical protein
LYSKSISSLDVTNLALDLDIKALQPALLDLNMSAGNAKTSFHISIVNCAVINVPERSFASTTKVHSASAATISLRTGKFCLLPFSHIGKIEITAPPFSTILLYRSAFPLG